eukprot:gnl/TRDRNA2_/TRDRNA2_161107_c0_seq1.p1 gnl/TRDRNA2_/TRDRNA2_161107_c0~~gnl/TRDRNA2_/TRDRNA2_161107_c0_seq1.p1  ORF type:complete len:417 (-),score=114.58 gnl/TRDRNA2_/TRDRNA2_161107_c0_seq1:105-1355(-)
MPTFGKKKDATFDFDDVEDPFAEVGAGGLGPDLKAHQPAKDAPAQREKFYWEEDKSEESTEEADEDDYLTALKQQQESGSNKPKAKAVPKQAPAAAAAGAPNAREDPAVIERQMREERERRRLAKERDFMLKKERLLLSDADEKDKSERQNDRLNDEHIPDTRRLNVQIVEETFRMCLQKEGLTVQEVLTIWEKEWAIRYASKVKFEAASAEDPDVWPPKRPTRWLARSDIVPSHPAVIRIEGQGSILSALATALKQRDSSKNVEKAQTPKISRSALVTQVGASQSGTMRALSGYQIEEKERQQLMNARMKKDMEAKALPWNADTGGVATEQATIREFNERVIEQGIRRGQEMQSRRADNARLWQSTRESRIKDYEAARLEEERTRPLREARLREQRQERQEEGWGIELRDDDASR